jgi:hypothetical protein
MPIENNEVFIPQDDFSRGIGFNPFEEPSFAVSTDDIVSWNDPISISLPSDANTQFQRMMRLRSDLTVGTTWAEIPVRKPRQKPIAKLLDEVAEANKDVFDSVNKVQEEIDKIEKAKLIEMADKHDNLLFLVIGKNYTLKGATEKQKSAYYNTLTQQLISTIRGLTNDIDYPLEDFKHFMLRHVSRYVALDDEMVVKFNILFEELYEYHNTIHAKKKEKRALMGREEKESTVCEDYINGGRESVRFSINNY